MTLFFESFKIIPENWPTFVFFLVLITGLYLLARFVRSAKRLADVLNLLVHTAMFIFCITSGAPAEVLLLLLLVSAVPALLI